MKIIEIDLIKEIGNVAEYKVTYQEETQFTIKKAGNTFNYEYSEIENIPDKVLDFVDSWILGEL